VLEGPVIKKLAVSPVVPPVAVIVLSPPPSCEHWIVTSKLPEESATNVPREVPPGCTTKVTTSPGPKPEPPRWSVGPVVPHAELLAPSDVAGDGG